MMKKRPNNKRRLALQPLENRRVLAASLGWDGPGLGSAELTYTINGSPSSLTQAETNAAIETAFDVWSEVADITFTETNQTGLRDSIDISFTNIDGTAGTLAQAYFPDDVNPARIAGDIQFDTSESWEIGNAQGNQVFDLVWVAVHEIGHSLGLEHTDVQGSVLSPFVSPNQSFSSLSSSDIAAVHDVYAAADGVVTTDVDDPVVDPMDGGTTDISTDDSDTGTDDNSVDTGNTDDDPFSRRRWRRGGNWRGFGGRLDAELVNFNYVNPTDVNGDNSTSGLDALMVINEINRQSSSGADSSDTDFVGLCDVNGDGDTTVMDALTVINAMNNSVESDTTEVAAIYATEPASETIDVGALNLTNEVEESIEDTTDDSEDDGEPVDGVDDTDTTVTEVDDTTDETGEVDDDSETIDDGGVIDDSDDTVDDVDEEEHCSDGHHRHGSGNLRFGMFAGDAESLVSRLDTNDDALLSEDEVSERLWKKLTDLGTDTDTDGLVSINELDVAISAVRQEIFAAKDTDADGLLMETEVSERFWNKISAANVDDDGGVSLDELDMFLSEQEPIIGEVGRPIRYQQASDAVFASLGRARGEQLFARARR